MGCCLIEKDVNLLMVKLVKQWLVNVMIMAYDIGICILIVSGQSFTMC